MTKKFIFLYKDYWEFSSAYESSLGLVSSGGACLGGRGRGSPIRQNVYQTNWVASKELKLSYHNGYIHNRVSPI